MPALTSRRLALPVVLLAAAGLSGCLTPKREPVLSRAVMDARAGLDVGKTAGCPALASPASIGFGFNESQIPDTAMPAAQILVLMMSCHPQSTALVVGEADNHGTDQEQHKLAADRVAAVTQYLTAHGIAAARLSTQVQGKTPAPSGQQLIVMAEGRRW